MSRLIQVEVIKITNVSSGSTSICGDTGTIMADTNALAVQRELPYFLHEEGNYADYKIFSQPISRLDTDLQVSLDADNLASSIYIGNINLLAVSSASIFQIGCNDSIELMSKTKAIRQFVTNAPGPTPFGVTIY